MKHESLQRMAWHAQIRPGNEAEYEKRHDEIWPEMSEALREAGIQNYSIWRTGHDLFGYYECQDLAWAAKIQAQSPVVKQWNEYMQDILIMDMDPMTGTTPSLKQVFYHP